MLAYLQLIHKLYGRHVTDYVYFIQLYLYIVYEYLHTQWHCWVHPVLAKRCLLKLKSKWRDNNCLSQAKPLTLLWYIPRNLSNIFFRFLLAKLPSYLLNVYSLVKIHYIDNYIASRLFDVALLKQNRNRFHINITGAVNYKIKEPKGNQSMDFIINNCEYF